MNLARHILKKDMRHLRVFLVFWISVVLLTALLSGLKATTDAGDIARQQLVQMVYGLMSALSFILLALIIPFLLHSEPLTGTTSFWITRPIKKIEVLKGKLMFIGLFLILPPVLADVALYLGSGIPPTLVLASIPENLFYSLALILPLMAAAVLTRNFGFYALVLAVYLVSSLVLTVIAYGVKLYSQITEAPDPATLLDSRHLLSTLTTVIISALIIFMQYRTRKTSRGFVMLGIQIAITFAIATYCPVKIFREPANLMSIEALTNVEAELNAERSIRIADAFNRNANTAANKEVKGELKFRELPENSYAKARKVDSTFEALGKKIRSHSYGSNYFDFRTFEQNPTVVADTIQPLELVQNNHYFNDDTTLLEVPYEDFLALTDEPGLYEAAIEFDIFQYHPVASIPLKTGARHHSEGSSFIIDSVLRNSSGCNVILREQHFTLLSNKQRTPDKGQEFIFVLINREKNEAFLKEYDYDFNIDVFNSQQMLEAQQKTLQFESKSGNAYLHPIDDEWLDAAELMILQVRWLGKTTTELTAEDFTFSASGGSFYNKSNDEKKSTTVDHTAITLPPGSTRNQIKTYALKVHAAFSDKEQADETAVEMLTEVGHEHLDILVNTAHYNPANSLPAIEKLAKPSDKELILKNLNRCGFLAKTVIQFGWLDDARETLIEGLNERDDLPAQWIEAVAALEEPGSYPALTKYFVEGRRKDETYAAIRNLPGFDIDRAVSKAWKAAKKDSKHDYGLMMPIMLEHGSIEVIRFYGDPKHELCDCNKDSVIAAVQKHTGQTGTDAELRAWCAANADTLRFDPASQRYLPEGSR
ncbi:ABC transporter permease [Pontiellaceae bacterium B12227]|nr:ABC transporter permease [Pontiellaceae bacterium B12227]